MSQVSHPPRRPQAQPPAHVARLMSPVACRPSIPPRRPRAQPLHRMSHVACRRRLSHVARRSAHFSRICQTTSHRSTLLLKTKMYRTAFYPFCIDFSFLSTESVAQVNADLQLRLDKTLTVCAFALNQRHWVGVWFCQMEVWTSASGMASQTRLHRRGLINWCSLAVWPKPLFLRPSSTWHSMVNWHSMIKFPNGLSPCPHRFQYHHHPSAPTPKWYLWHPHKSGAQLGNDYPSGCGLFAMGHYYRYLQPPLLLRVRNGRIPIPTTFLLGIIIEK